MAKYSAATETDKAITGAAKFHHRRAPGFPY
jgi:hypothetical protein